MPPPTPKSDSAPRRFLLILLCIPVLLILLLVYWRAHLYFSINKQLSAVRSAGLPASGAELNAWLPRIPDSENGALVLTQAFKRLHEFSEFREPKSPNLIVPKHNETWLPEQRTLAERYVVTNRAVLAEIESTLNRYSKFRYPADYSFGAGTLIPHLKYIKLAAQNFRYQTILRATDGDAAWTNSVLLQLKLADTLNDEPSVIGFLVRNAVINIAARSAEYALNHSAPDPAACRALQAAFLHVIETNTLPTALIGERAIYIPYFRMSRADMEATVSNNADEEGDHASPQTTRPSGQGFPPLMLLGFFERDLDFYLTTMDKGIAASRFDPPASLQLTNIFDVGDYAHRHFYIFSAMCLPALSKSASKLANGQAAARLAATAFAIEAYRQTHNSLPSALNDLTADFLASVPKDPFDGQPIRYRRAARGYLLYSVDADGHDDNGVEPPPRRKPKDPATYDFSFTVGR